MIEELTAELEDSERATYERVIRVLAHEANNAVGATGSVLASLLAYRSQLTDADSVDFSTADEGSVVRLSIIDSGGLLDAPVRQLFTPFFSTKKGGQGIGLMFVREVLTRHQCRYALAAGTAGETRFDIWFGTGGG